MAQYYNKSLKKLDLPATEQAIKLSQAQLE